MRRPFAIGVVAFLTAAGMTLAPGATGQAAQQGNPGHEGHMRHSPVVLEKVEGTSLTVKGEDGTSKVIQVEQTTPIQDSANCAASDLKQGESVRLYGTKNADGTFAAKRVMVSQEDIKMPNRPGTPSEVLTGKVESVQPLKVKDDAGQVVAVTVDAEARVSRMTSVTLTDLKVGDRLMVRPGETAGSVGAIMRVPEGAFQHGK